MKPGCCVQCLGQVIALEVFADKREIRSDLTLEEATRAQTDIDQAACCFPCIAWLTSDLCTDSCGCAMCIIPCTIATLLWCIVVPVPYWCCGRSPTLVDIVRDRKQQPAIDAPPSPHTQPPPYEATIRDH